MIAKRWNNGSQVPKSPQIHKLADLSSSSVHQAKSDAGDGAMDQCHGPSLTATAFALLQLV